MMSLRMVAVLALAVSAQAVGDVSIPRAAHRHRADLEQYARRYFGPEAQVSRLAAQVHQESAWNEAARSPVGAENITQFMPSTRKWIIQKYPTELGGVDYRSGKWALHAQAIYMRDLMSQVRIADTDCDRWAFALRGYNGGLGYIHTEQKRAERPGNAESVAVQCYRSAAACRENREYPIRIMQRIEPTYIKAGWGGSLCK